MKMIIMLTKICLIIFSVIFHIEAVNTTKSKSDVASLLFKQPGWKNLTDASYVKYLDHLYYLNFITETDTNISNSDDKVRAATIFLAFSYANVLISLTFYIESLRYCCTYYFNKNNTNLGYNCTYLLVENIKEILLMAKQMKGAMDALDDLHSVPWKKNNFILESIFEELQTCSNTILEWERNHNVESLLNSIKMFFCNIKLLIYTEINSYGEFKLYDFNLESKELHNKFKSVHNSMPEYRFCDFISKQIMEIIVHTNINKYNNLGFMYDTVKKETCIYCGNEVVSSSKSDETSTPVLIDFLKKGLTGSTSDDISEQQSNDFEEELKPLYEFFK